MAVEVWIWPFQAFTTAAKLKAIFGGLHLAATSAKAVSSSQSNSQWSTATNTFRKTKFIHARVPKDNNITQANKRANDRIQ